MWPRICTLQTDILPFTFVGRRSIDVFPALYSKETLQSMDTGSMEHVEQDPAESTAFQPFWRGLSASSRQVAESLLTLSSPS